MPMNEARLAELVLDTHAKPIADMRRDALNAAVSLNAKQ
ncbi:hypothetical protein MCBRY_001329 [Methylocystis bryophila]